MAAVTFNSRSVYAVIHTGQAGIPQPVADLTEMWYTTKEMHTDLSAFTVGSFGDPLLTQTSMNAICFQSASIATLGKTPFRIDDNDATQAFRSSVPQSESNRVDFSMKSGREGQRMEHCGLEMG